MSDDTDNTKFINSPIEEVFDIEPGSTMSNIQLPKQSSPDTVDAAIDDDHEDRIIKSQLNTVYDYAIETFEKQSEELQLVDPKYSARTAEVAAQYLKIALDSADVRSRNKYQKDKLKIKANGGPETINNNLIVADRNELLKMMNDEEN